MRRRVLKPTTLYFVRHGETVWNREKRYMSTTDLALTPAGHSQIQKLKKKLKGISFAAVYASPSKRAVQSVGRLVSGLETPAIPDTRLMEMRFGEWEGKTAKVLLRHKNKNFLKWMKGMPACPEGGESLLAVKRRSTRFLKDCLRSCAGKDVLIVSHAGPIRCMLANLLKLPSHLFFSFHLDTASVSIIQVHSSGQAQCLSLNQTG